MKKKKNQDYRSNYYNMQFDDLDQYNENYMNEISDEIYRANISPYPNENHDSYTNYNSRDRYSKCGSGNCKEKSTQNHNESKTK